MQSLNPIAASAYCVGSSPVACGVQAFEEAAAKLRSTISLVLVFVSSPNNPKQVEQLAKSLYERVPNATILGGSSSGIVGQGVEVENQSAVSVLVMGGLTRAPETFFLEYQSTGDGPSFLGQPDSLLDPRSHQNGLFLLADPYSFPVHLFMKNLADNQSFAPVLGGYVGAGIRKGDVRMIYQDRAVSHGCVGMVIPDELRMVPLVSQGCRPIGEPMIVTRIDGDLVLELAGKPALEQLRELFRTSPTRDQELMQRAILLGIAVHGYHDQLTDSDFLVRQCYAVTDPAPAIVSVDRLRLGQTVQFHLRDAQSASADLQRRLKTIQRTFGNPVAACLVSCNGRGVHMFQSDSHDAKTLGKYFPKSPLAGFFAAGEFGPIGQQSYIHGFTATAAMIYEKNRKDEQQK